MTFKELMQQKGYTNNILARDAGIGQATVCEIANGNRKTVTLSTADKLAKTLDVSIEVIKSCIGDEANESKKSNC